MELFDKYKITKKELEILKQKEVINNFLEIENKKLRSLIDENINVIINNKMTIFFLA